MTMVQTVQRQAEVPQVEYINEVVHLISACEPEIGVTLEGQEIEDTITLNAAINTCEKGNLQEWCERGSLDDVLACSAADLKSAGEKGSLETTTTCSTADSINVCEKGSNVIGFDTGKEDLWKIIGDSGRRAQPRKKMRKKPWEIIPREP